MKSLLKERCVEARKAAGYKTVPPFAREIGVEPATIYYIENGQTRSPDAQTLAGYARVTGYSVEWLRTGRGQKMNTDVSVFGGTLEEASQTVAQQRALIAVTVRLIGYVRDMALDPISMEREPELIEAAIRVAESVGADRILDGSALPDAARQVVAILRSRRSETT